MKLSLHHGHDALLIHSCALTSTDRGEQRYRICIANTWYAQSLIITSQAVELWDATDFSALRMVDFQRLAELNKEVVILGVGTPAQFKLTGFPHAALTQPLMQQRIGLEAMDTAAACRTYNILAGDGRNVAAALLV